MIIPIGHEETQVRRLPWVTFGLILACLAVLLATDAEGPVTSYDRWGLVPLNPSPVTAATHMFMHGGWVHLIGNMLALLQFLWVDLRGVSAFCGLLRAAKGRIRGCSGPRSACTGKRLWGEGKGARDPCFRR